MGFREVDSIIRFGQMIICENWMLGLQQFGVVA